MKTNHQDSRANQDNRAKEPDRAPSESLSGPRVDLLWVTAIALAAVVIVQLGGRFGAGPAEPTALADMVAQVGDYALMTTAASEDEEQLYVLDNRNEQLLVYGIVQNRTLELLAREDLKSVFANARAQAGGR